MMVCEHPYFAVTDATGAFRIANLPAGVALEFRVWHEKAGYIQTAIVDGASQTWSKGRFTRNLSDGDDVKLEVAVEASLFQ